MNEKESKLALDIFDVGAMKSKEQSPGGLGFKLKLHETQRDAPLSPFFMNLRTSDNPKPGPLTQAIVDDIGKALYELAKSKRLNYQYVVGVPNAGDPLAEAFACAAWQEGSTVSILRMKKETGADSRHVTDLTTSVVKGSRVLVIDDLITRASSKVEAIEVLTAAGLVVSGSVVLIDREQGGIAELEKTTKVPCFSVFKISELLGLYMSKERISEEAFKEIITYLKAA